MCSTFCSTFLYPPLGNEMLRSRTVFIMFSFLRINESTERGTTGSGQFINVGAVPLCPPVGWLGRVRLFRLFVYSSIARRNRWSDTGP